MLENILNAITRLQMDRLGRNLGGHIPSCPRHVRHDAVAMATANGALNIMQLWASGGRTREPILMKFGMQQQVRTAITVMRSNIKIFKIQNGGRSFLESIRNAITQTDWDATLVVASHHVPNIGNAITPLMMGPIGTTLGWSRPSNTYAAKPFPWYLVVTANRTVNVLVLWGVQIKKHRQFS